MQSMPLVHSYKITSNHESLVIRSAAEASCSARPVSQNLVNGSLEITFSGIDADQTVEIHLPELANLTVYSAASRTINIQGSFANVIVHSSAGAIESKLQTVHDLGLSCDAGQITARVSNPLGDVTLKTTPGNIEFSCPAALTVEAATEFGAMHLDATAPTPGAKFARLISQAGDIHYSRK